MAYKKIKQDQVEFLKGKKEEKRANEELIEQYNELRDLGQELLPHQEKRLQLLQTEQALQTTGLNLEKELNKQSQSGNAEKAKQAQLGKGMLDSLKASLKAGDITVSQFKDQAAIIQQIASGQLDSAAIQDILVDNAGNLTAEMEQFLKTQKKANKNSEMMKGAISEADSATGGLGSTIMGFVSNPLTGIIALLTAFAQGTDEIGAKFGAIGVKDFRSELGAARKEFIGMGLDGSAALDVVSDLAGNFGIAFDKAVDLASTVGEIAKVSGISTEEAANLVGIFTELGGLSAEEAENVAKGTLELARANNVAPDKVLADIANSTEAFAMFGGMGAEAFAEAAVQARKLGSDVDSMAKSARGMLNFQESISAEMEASVMMGRRLDLTRARELALQGPTLEFQKEIVKQMGSAAKFNAMDVLTKEALAKALNFEVGELSKIVNKTKEQKTLAGEISRLEPSELISEDAMSSIAQTISNIKLMGLELVETYGPQINEIFQALADIMMPIAERAVAFLTSFAEGDDMMGSLKSSLGAIASVLAVVATLSVVASLANIVSSFSKIPVVGAVLGIAAAVGFAAYIASLMGGLETGTEIGGIKKDSVHQLHAGETVLNKQDTEMLRKQQSAISMGRGGNMGGNMELRQLKEEIVGLRQDMKKYFDLGGSVPRTIVSGVGEALNSVG